MAIDAPARSKKRVSLKEMIRWAYGRQMVDVLTGRTLDDSPECWHSFVAGFVADSALRALRAGQLGTAVDCGGSARFARNDVHPDAEALHDSVLELGPIGARLVIEFGHKGTFPEPEEPVAHPVPFNSAVTSSTRGGAPPSRRRGVGIESWEWREGEGLPGAPDRCGQCTWRGEGMRYTIRLAETIVERVPIFVVVGRRRTKISHYEERRFEVEYCPLRWDPDLPWCQATAAVAEYFDAALARLLELLADVELRDHEIAELAPAG